MHLKMLPQKNINWSLVLAIIFLHLMIARPLGYPLTIAPFALAYFIYKHYKFGLKPASLLIAVLLLLWPLVILIRYDLFGRAAALDEFAKTYLLWIFALLTMVVCFANRIRNQIDYSREFLILIGLITLFSIIQVLAARVLNSTALYYPFGDFSYKGVRDETRFVYDEFARAPAFYLEPSFCAFILFFLTVSILMKENRPSKIVLLVSGVICSMLIVGSASGAFSVGGLAVLVLPGLLKNRMVRFITAMSLLAVIIAGALWIMPQRIAEVGVEGTSGYWRLVAPLIILSKVFGDFPLGIPLGQAEIYIEPLGLQHGGNGGVVGLTIDNGMYYLIFLFGWLAVIFLIGLLSKLAIAVFNNDRPAIILWWFILMSMQFSGGIFLPEYIFPLLLVVYTYRVEKLHRKYSVNERARYCS